MKKSIIGLTTALMISAPGATWAADYRDATAHVHAAQVRNRGRRSVHRQTRGRQNNLYDCSDAVAKSNLAHERPVAAGSRKE